MDKSKPLRISLGLPERLLSDDEGMRHGDVTLCIFLSPPSLCVNQKKHVNTGIYTDSDTHTHRLIPIQSNRSKITLQLGHRIAQQFAHPCLSRLPRCQRTCLIVALFCLSDLPVYLLVSISVICLPLSLSLCFVLAGSINLA